MDASDGEGIVDFGKRLMTCESPALDGVRETWIYAGAAQYTRETPSAPFELFWRPPDGRMRLGHPLWLLEALGAAVVGEVETVGTDLVRGTQAVHLRFALLATALALVPTVWVPKAARFRRPRFSAEVWIDKQGLFRRLSHRDPSGLLRSQPRSLWFTLELWDFGEVGLPESVEDELRKADAARQPEHTPPPATQQP